MKQINRVNNMLTDYSKIKDNEFINFSIDLNPLLLPLDRGRDKHAPPSELVLAGMGVLCPTRIRGGWEGFNNVVI